MTSSNPNIIHHWLAFSNEALASHLGHGAAVAPVEIGSCAADDMGRSWRDTLWLSNIAMLPIDV